MKKTVGILLVLMLLFSFSAPAFAAVEDTSGGVWNAEFSGYTVPIPEAYRTATGFIHFFDFGGGLEFEGTGVMFSRIYYTGMTGEERLAAVDEIDMAFLMEEWDLGTKRRKIISRAPGNPCVSLRSERRTASGTISPALRLSS